MLGLVVLLLAQPGLSPAEGQGAPADNRVRAAPCDCLPRACHDQIDEGFLDERRCRPRHWSCVNDPCESCVGLAWAPVRIGIAVVLAPVFITKPKCGRFPDPVGVALFFVFGVPIEECPEPRIPSDVPPPPPPRENEEAPPDGSAPDGDGDDGDDGEQGHHDDGDGLVVMRF